MSKTKLPTGWSQSRVGDVVENRIEQGLPNDKREFTYIDISAVDNRLKEIVDPKTLPTAKAPSRARQQLKCGDVIVSTTRPNLNAVALVPTQLDGAIASTGFAVLRPVLLEPRWLYSVVQAEDFVAKMSAQVKGALYPAIRPSHVHDFVMPVPPLAEQKRITNKLTKLLKRTRNVSETLKALPALMQQYRSAVLEAACSGRLVLTEAELAHKERRDFEPASVLLERILDERRTKWEAEQLAKLRATGKITKSDRWKNRYEQSAAPYPTHDLSLPKGWAWASLEQCSCMMQYGTSAKTNDLGEGIPVIRMGNIIDGQLRLDDLRFLPKSHTEFPELLLQKGDVLFNRTNSAELVGKTTVFKEAGHYSFASYLIRLRLLNGCVPEFVAFFINSPFGRKWVASVAGQVTNQANISGAKLGALAVPLPPVAEQHRIVAEVERRLSTLMKLKSQIEAALEQTTALRISFFNLALSGKLVPQDRSDESASQLLLRIRNLKDGLAKKPKLRLYAPSPLKLEKLAMLTLEDITPTHLADILRKHDGPLDAKALWIQSQLAIDDFYAQLKKELGKSLKETGKNRLLEVKS